MDSSTRLTTNSCVSRIFRAVSFGEPSARSPGAMASIGGSAASKLKKLKGGAVIFPSGRIVGTNAKGGGVTTLANKAYLRSAYSYSRVKSMRMQPARRGK